MLENEMFGFGGLMLSALGGDVAYWDKTNLTAWYNILMFILYSSSAMEWMVGLCI